jgi:hypothetical protein
MKIYSFEGKPMNIEPENKFLREILAVFYTIVGAIAVLAVIYWLYFCVFTWIPE